MIQSYDEAHRYLQHGRYGSPANPKLSPDRPMYNNTRLRIVDSIGRGALEPMSAGEQPLIAVTHWDTNVVTFYPDDTVVVTDGGYMSVSTLDRISHHAKDFIPGGRVFRQRNQLWFFETVGETPRKNIKCPGCHIGREETDAHLIGRLEGRDCERCYRTENKCWQCNNTGLTWIGGNKQYRGWDGYPTRFSRGGEEA